MEAGGVLGEEGGAELGGDLDADLADLVGLVGRPARRRSRSGVGDGAAVHAGHADAGRRRLTNGITPGRTGLSQPSSASSSTMRR